VRKHSKTQSPNGAASATTAAPDSAPIQATLSQSKKPSKAIQNPARKAASKKTSAKKAASPTRVRASKPKGPSDADIRLRAYFIAERRVQLALQGDPAKDWLEARRQLMEEADQAGPN
jgi:hypothetical protein